MTEARAKRERTCIGCGKRSDKVELLRLVRNADKSVAFDAGGRASGRGAYVCSMECLEHALETRKLQRALRCGIEREDAQRIVADMAEALAQVR